MTNYALISNVGQIRYVETVFVDKFNKRKNVNKTNNAYSPKYVKIPYAVTFLVMFLNVIIHYLSVKMENA